MLLDKEQVIRVRDLDNNDNNKKEEVEDKFEEEELEKQLYTILKFDDEKDKIMIEKERDIERSDEEIVFYGGKPAAGCSRLQDWKFKKDQNKQIVKLLNENFDFYTQSISELEQTDIIHHHILTQDVWPV
ncbi:27006_t:CDS:2 [Racocetra persica]|uniref:27006_t:CDS:1 n=1 Tax=Racocetra persica TaxID=160502 RepID=A0ACA9LN59_9GLOM|nr:27006_t:CDS:2 [Racocetra persica]